MHKWLSSRMIKHTRTRWAGDAPVAIMPDKHTWWLQHTWRPATQGLCPSGQRPHHR
jgi:hypothetical protein